MKRRESMKGKGRNQRTVTGPTMTAALLRAIETGGQTLYRISRDTGVDINSLSGFLKRQQSLRLDKADLLARHFGLRLRPARKRRE